MRASRDLMDALRPGWRGAWDRFWFGEGPLLRLAIFRILVLCMALYALEFHRLSLFQGNAASEFVSRRYVPLYFLELLRIGPLSQSLALYIYYGLWISISLALLGLFTRLTCWLSALGMLLWIGMGYSYGQPHHEYGMLAFALLALPFGPVGERLSLDAWLRRRRASRSGAMPVPREWAPGAMLPLRFVQVSIVIGYLSAGTSKLRFGGLDWMNGYTLQAFMLEFDGALTEHVSSHLSLVRLMSVGVIAIQCSCFLAVIWQPLRWFYVPAIIAVHIGSQYLMDTGTFLGLWMLMACFMDLERVSSFLGQRMTQGARWRRLFWGTLLLFGCLWLASMYVHKGPRVVPYFLAAAWLGGYLRRRRR